MSHRSKPPFRADHVGSFLRPPALLAARERFGRGEIDAIALRQIAYYKDRAREDSRRAMAYRNAADIIEALDDVQEVYTSAALDLPE